MVKQKESLKKASTPKEKPKKTKSNLEKVENTENNTKMKLVKPKKTKPNIEKVVENNTIVKNNIEEVKEIKLIKPNKKKSNIDKKKLTVVTDKTNTDMKTLIKDLDNFEIRDEHLEAEINERDARIDSEIAEFDNDNEKVLVNKVEHLEAEINERDARIDSEIAGFDNDNEIKSEIEPVEEIKKKRGRKKKEVVVEKIKKRRGRKAAVKYFSSGMRKNLMNNVINDQNNYILHLDVDENISAQVENGSQAVSLLDNNTFDTNSKENININIIGYESVIINKTLDILDKKDDTLDTLDIDLNVTEIEELDTLYETRINDRVKQDKLLIDKLEDLKNDSIFIENLIKNTDNCCETKLEETNNDYKKLGFFKILQKFVDNDTWLENVDVCCWWCCHNFTDIPIGNPVYYNKKKDKFRVQGVFCGFSCMASYSDSINIKDKSLIKHFYTVMTNDSITKNIKRAPPRESLKMFGGQLDIETFRKNSTESKIYKRIDYPMYISRDYIEEVDIKNIKNKNSNVFDTTTTSHNTNIDSSKQIEEARMRLNKQIEKTTITESGTIDKFLNFE